MKEISYFSFYIFQFAFFIDVFKNLTQILRFYFI